MNKKEFEQWVQELEKSEYPIDQERAKKIRELETDRNKWESGAKSSEKRNKELRFEMKGLLDFCHDKNYWAWTDDDDNDLPSLTCPIVIRPDQLRALIEGADEALVVKCSMLHSLVISCARMWETRIIALADKRTRLLLEEPDYVLGIAKNEVDHINKIVKKVENLK